MADVELMALTTEVGVDHRTVTRGHGVSDGAGLTFCGEGGLGLTPFFIGAPFPGTTVCQTRSRASI